MEEVIKCAFFTLKLTALEWSETSTPFEWSHTDSCRFLLLYRKYFALINVYLINYQFNSSTKFLTMVLNAQSHNPVTYDIQSRTDATRA